MGLTIQDVAINLWENSIIRLSSEAADASTSSGNESGRWLQPARNLLQQRRRKLLQRRKRRTVGRGRLRARAGAHRGARVREVAAGDQRQLLEAIPLRRTQRRPTRAQRRRDAAREERAAGGARQIDLVC